MCIRTNEYINCNYWFITRKKIILLSNHPSLFFNCCKILLSLIYPFQWIHFYKPFIPPCDPYINQYLSLSGPALFGLLSSSITKLPNNFNGIIVTLDNNTIELHNITLSADDNEYKDKNGNKQPLEELLLACDAQQKDEIATIIARLQLQFVYILFMNYLYHQIQDLINYIWIHFIM